MTRTTIRLASALVALLVSSSIAAQGLGRLSVRQYGARGDGRTDDTAAFQEAVSSTPAGGLLVVPAGHYVLTDTVVITRPITLEGEGRASQILGSGPRSLIRIAGVNGASVRDLYLGSASNAAGVSLIELDNSHRNDIRNITMLGGNVGLAMKGALLNVITNLQTGVNAGGFFAPTARNVTWVEAVRDSATRISCNANTFIAPVLEGGTHGIHVSDAPDSGCEGCTRNGEGSLVVTGGTIEGVSGVALHVDRTFLASSITGVHFEANGQDVQITNAANVRLEAVTSLGGPGGSGAAGIHVTGPLCRNIQVTDSIAQQVVLDPAARRIVLTNLTTDLQCTGVSGVTPSVPWDPSVTYVNVGLNCL